VYALIQAESLVFLQQWQHHLHAVWPKPTIALFVDLLSRHLTISTFAAAMFKDGSQTRSHSRRISTVWQSRSMNNGVSAMLLLNPQGDLRASRAPVILRKLAAHW